MFNIGPMELMVLAIIGLIVLGPDRLPGLAREAAQLIRSLRDLATGARQQLRDELGPEFADVDLRNLNPRAAVQRAVFGDDVDLRKLNPRTAVRDAIFGDEDLRAADPRSALRETTEELRDDGPPVSLGKPVTMNKAAAQGPARQNGARQNSAQQNGAQQNGVRPNGTRPRPRPRPASTTPYDDDAT
jgi:sec-independent protein translocase protein TatB